MSEQDPVTGEATGDADATLTKGRSRNRRPATAPAQELEPSTEKIVWEALPGGVRLRVWNSDRCWKAIQTQYAFCIVHRGVAEWQYRGQTFNVAAGGVYPLEPGEVHSTRKVHRTGDFSVFFLDTQWVSNLASELCAEEHPHFEARGLQLIESWRIAESCS